MLPHTAPKFIFQIPALIIPAVRMTQASKWNARSQAYLASQSHLSLLMRSQMSANGWFKLPPRTTIAVAIELTSPKVKHNCDIDNLAKAVLDAANGIVWPDDRWIDTLFIRRRPGAEQIVTLMVWVL